MTGHGDYEVGPAEKLSNALDAKMRVLGFRQEKKRKKPDGECGVKARGASQQRKPSLVAALKSFYSPPVRSAH